MWAINQLFIETVARLIIRLTEKQPEQFFKYNKIAQIFSAHISFFLIFFLIKKYIEGSKRRLFLSPSLLSSGGISSWLYLWRGLTSLLPIYVWQNSCTWPKISLRLVSRTSLSLLLFIWKVKLCQTSMHYCFTASSGHSKLEPYNKPHFTIIPFTHA